jgi:hypothetical protein
MTFESVNQKVKEYQFVVALFVVYLLYAVYYNAQAISGLHGEAMTLNPYATRLPTIVDSGLTTNQVLEWGNQVNGNNCPTPDQADAYLASTAGIYYGNTEGQMQNNDESFMSGYEPPIFWPIGNVQKVRDSRIVQSAPNRKHSWNNNQNVNYNNNANNTGFQYTTSNVPMYDTNGNGGKIPRYMMNGNGQQMMNNNGNPMPETQQMYTRCAPGENVVDNVCVENYASNPNGWQSNNGRKELFGGSLEEQFEY